MKYTFIITTVLLIIILLQRECGHRKELRVWDSINSELTTELDKSGFQVSALRVVNDTRKDAIKKLQSSRDSLNIKLAEAIKEAGRRVETVTTVKSTTVMDGTATTTIYKIDTIIIKGDSIRPDTVFLFPIYESEYKDNWIEYKLQAGHDSTLLNLQVFNDYQITHKNAKGGFDVFVKNRNPNTTTTDVRAFFIKQKPKRLGVGIHAGFGVSALGEVRPFVGVGLNYNFIQL